MQGVEYMHEMRIIHRDLKPDNILRDSTGKVKICDFGLSIHCTAPLDRLRDFCGTAAYYPPEMLDARGPRGATFAADIWTIGVIIFELINGYTPFAPNDCSKEEMFANICAIKYK